MTRVPEKGAWTRFASAMTGDNEAEPTGSRHSGEGERDDRGRTHDGGKRRSYNP